VALLRFCVLSSSSFTRKAIRGISKLKMAGTSKKRVYSEIVLNFNEKWTDLYFFVETDGKPVCLICQESISTAKEYNLKRH
jgi:hypothetical protein